MPDVRGLMVEVMERHHLGGAAVAVVRTGELPALENVGLADRKTARPIDSDTVFRIASISKTMTAVGLMQLRDLGLFGLDDPVNEYLKTFTVEAPPGGSEVTFRHLLTHVAGIGELPRVSDLVRREAWGAGRPRTQGSDLARLYQGTLRAETVAGSKWAYANHGFAVLGRLVEDISRQPFSEYMREHLFGPLGMERTECVRTDRTDDRLATGYHSMFGRLLQVKDYDLTLLGVGSVLSSVSDMATYAEWLLHGGPGPEGEVLRPQTLSEMMSAQYSVDSRIPAMGLAFFLDEFRGHRVAGHGNNPGFASALLLAPGRDSVLSCSRIPARSSAPIVSLRNCSAPCSRSLTPIPGFAQCASPIKCTDSKSSSGTTHRHLGSLRICALGSCSAASTGDRQEGSARPAGTVAAEPGPPRAPDARDRKRGSPDFCRGTQRARRDHRIRARQGRLRRPCCHWPADLLHLPSPVRLP